MPQNRLKGILIAFIGITILGPDTLLVRLLDMQQWPLQFWREFGTALFLFTALGIGYGGKLWEKTVAIGRIGILAGFFFAMSSILFIAALYLTTVGNTLAIISSAPVWGALLSKFFLKEHLPMRTWVATALCVVCIGIIVSGDIGFGERDSLLGDFLALFQAFFMGTAFVLVRSRPNVNMLPCRALGGLITAAFSLVMALCLDQSLAMPAAKLPLLSLLCFFVLPVSFGLLVVAPRFVPAPEVSMIMLLEMVYGPLLVWIFTGETVPLNTFIGGGLLFAVLLVHSALGARPGNGGVPARVR